MFTRSSHWFVGLVVLLLFAGGTPAQAQQWAQSVEIVSEVKSGRPNRAFLDSLVQQMRARDSIRVRRSPEADDRVTLSRLQETLLEQGLGLFSANRVFVQYEFKTRGDNFVEQIRSLHYVFRPPAGGQTDVDILYLDASDPLVKDVLRNQGLPNPNNLEAVNFFKDDLSFANLTMAHSADIVAVAGSPIRGEFDERRQRLLDRFRHFVYRKDLRYVPTVE